MPTINTVRDAALIKRASELKKAGYIGCVKHDGMPCYCAKMVAGELHCGPTKKRTRKSVEIAKECSGPH